MPSDFRLWSNSLAVQEHFRSSCNPLRKIGKKRGDRGHYSQDSIPTGRALEPIKEAGGLVLAQKFQTASSGHAAKRVRPNALINSCRRPISQSNWDALAKERALIRNGETGSLTAAYTLSAIAARVGH